MCLRASKHPTAFMGDCALSPPWLFSNGLSLSVQAFEQGGGGKKAEALRALAEAKAAAKAAAKSGGSQANSESSAAPRDGPDPRHVPAHDCISTCNHADTRDCHTSYLAHDSNTAPCDKHPLAMSTCR